jgi:tRNA acetyltransferase TAN1
MGRFKHQSSRRNYHQNKNFSAGSFSSNSNTIQIGQHGFFVTFCSTKESFVRNEIYNLLNRFADQLFGAEFSDEKQIDTTDLNDLDSALENEKKQLKNSNKKTRRFQIVKSGTKHSFFVTTTLSLTSLNQLIELIFHTSIESKEQHSRYIERLLPISFICKAYDDELRKLIIKNEFLEQILSLIDQNDSSMNTIWFDVQAKKSNNTQLKSSQLEEIIINDLISRKSEDLNGKIFKRDYKKPAIHILIHVIKNLMLISIVRNYEQYKKYNLASINLATTTEQQQQQQNKITFNDDNDDDDDDDE